MTADEIVKALRLCGRYVASCDACPYKFNPDGTLDMDCCEHLCNDAADLIEQARKE